MKHRSATVGNWHANSTRQPHPRAHLLLFMLSVVEHGAALAQEWAIHAEVAASKVARIRGNAGEELIKGRLVIQEGAAHV